jgi:heptosyltransferase-2
MSQPDPRPSPKGDRDLASRALFYSSGALACAIGRIAGRSGRNENGALLVVQLGDIGDLVLTSAFLRELGRAASNRGQDLVLVVKPGVHGIAELCPYASRVHSFDARRTRAAGALSGLLRARRFARSELSGEFGSAWNARFDLDEMGATFLMLNAGATRRIGYSEHVVPSKELRNHGYDCLLTDPVMPAPGASRHEVNRLLALLEANEVPVVNRDLELWLADEDRDAARNILAQAGGRLPVALGVGAGHPKRCWPAARFAQVAERLSQDHNAIAVLVGGPAERPAADEIAARSQAPIIDAVGQLPLRASAALVAECGLFVGNDSGLLHIAAAAGLPVVETSCHPLSGDPEHPNSPERFGPYGTTAVVLRPEHSASPDCAAGCESPEAHCIEEIPATEVLEGIARTLEATRLGSSRGGR